MSTPLLSVIVPAFQGEGVLPTVLDALHASDLPRSRWELIVVDDASTDATAAIAATRADLVVRLDGAPRGPAFARNAGVERARGAWVVFVDADVRVHRDTLSRFVAVIESERELDAVFGAYDDSPPAPDVLSQYRNLMHRLVHLTGAGESESFWAGCGAVRREAFLAAGGFDAARYPRPQIEDIELGYRLRARGGRILLRPEIQGAHLKRWTFWRSMKVDLFDRGLPWVRLLLERDRLRSGTQLNLRAGERLKAVGVVAALLLLLLAPLLRQAWPALTALLLLAAVAIGNRQQLAWLRARRGTRFVIAALPLHFLYYLVSAAAVAMGLVERNWRRPVPARPPHAGIPRGRR